MKNEAVVAAVIALLNGIFVDGETMEYILNMTGMRDQMVDQLGVTAQMPEQVLDMIADDIASDLNNEGVDLIEDQTYGINANEIYLEDVDYDRYRIKAVVRDTLRAHFEAVE